MKLILDTNVFVSGVFFSGPPRQILQRWRNGQITLVLSDAILDEYQRVGALLAQRYSDADLQPFLRLATVHAEMIDAPPLPEAISEDADDDKFLACAVASGLQLIISGDKHLLKVSGWRSIEVLPPRRFVDRYPA